MIYSDDTTSYVDFNISRAGTIPTPVNINNTSILLGKVSVLTSLTLNNNTSTILDATTIKSSLNVSGNTNIYGLTTLGASSISSTLNVSGSSTLNNTTIEGTLTVSGLAIFNSNIGIGTNNPNTSSILDLTSTTKGLLPPRMTTSQRTAILTPAQGLIVYDTTLNSLYTSDSSTWTAVGSGSGSGITGLTAFYVPLSSSTSTLTNSIIYQTSGNIGLGTTTPSALLHVSGTAILIGATTISSTLNISGTTGIGTSAPTAKLHIIQEAAQDSFRVDDVANDTTRFIVDQDGNVGIGASAITTKLYVGGTTLLDGATTLSSTLNVIGLATLNGLAINGSTYLNGGTVMNSLGIYSVNSSYITNFATNWTRYSPGGTLWGGICWASEIGTLCAVGSSNSRIGISTNGISWTLSTINSFGQQWEKICWSSYLGIFCMVASAGTNRIAVSADGGRNWIYPTYTGTPVFFNVCWSSTLKLFCAVGSSVVYTSPDGYTWTSRTPAQNNTWVAVCWSPELSLFCAVSNTGTGNRVMTSSDGITWTSRTSASNSVWKSIDWSPQLGLFSVVGGNATMFSSDGITWSSGMSVFGNWIRVIWIKELNVFYAIANSYGSTANRLVMYSYDGAVWILTSPQNVSYEFADACWTPELGILVATDLVGISITTNGVFNNTGLQVHGTNKGLQLSRLTTTQKNKLLYPCEGLTVYDTTEKRLNIWDGKSWVGQQQKYLFLMNDTDTNSFTPISSWSTATCTDNNWSSICWSSTLNIFCAVGYSGTGNRVMTSPDGINWTTRTSAADNNWTSVCWSPYLNLFCAVSSSGTNRAMTSPDGITWTIRALSSSYDWQSVCWAAVPLRFVAVANTGATSRIFSSTNGITWTSVTTSVLPYTFVTYINDISRYVALSPTNTSYSVALVNTVFSVVSGINTPTTNEWDSVCYSPELKLLCAVSRTGGNDRVMVSTDGTNWYTRTTPNNNWQSIEWSPELKLFCAVANSGTGNRIMTSPDGLTWTARTSPADNNWTSICWSPTLNMFVAVADSGTNRVMYSQSILPKNNSAILDIYSTNQGFLPPRMTTTQKSSISSPATGLVVYDTTLNNLSYYSGSSWTDVALNTWSSETSIIINGTTSAPTKGITTTDFIIYKKLSNDNEYEINLKYVQNGVGNSGSGDYLFTLPGGLKFATNKGQDRYTTLSPNIDAYSYFLKGSGNIVLGTISATNNIGIIPYNDTQFRIMILNSGTIASIKSDNYSLNNSNITYIINFTFFAQ